MTSDSKILKIKTGIILYVKVTPSQLDVIDDMESVAKGSGGSYIDSEDLKETIRDDAALMLTDWLMDVVDNAAGVNADDIHFHL